MVTMFGCSPTRSFNKPKSVASRFKERTRSARKQNLNTRSVLSLLSRPSQTSPKPPSPSFLSNTQPVPGTARPPPKHCFAAGGNEPMRHLAIGRLPQSGLAFFTDLADVDRFLDPLH